MRLLIIFFLIVPVIAFASKNPLSEGFLFLEKKNYPRAFFLFSSIKVKNPEVYTAMGMAKALNGDYEKALGYLFKAIEDNKEKEKWVPNYFIGISFYNLKRFDDAVPFLVKAYKLTADVSILKNIAQSAYKAGRYLDAEKFAKELYSIENNEENLILLLNIFEQLKKFKDVDELSTRFLETNQESSKVLYERAKARFYSGQMVLAEKDLEKAVLLNKDLKNMAIYTTIKKLNRKEEKELSDTKKNYIKIEWAVYLISIIFLSVIPVFVYKRKKLISQKEKLFFANTLLEKADYINALNIFTQLRSYKCLNKEAVTGALRAHILLGKKKEAISLAEQLDNEGERFFYLALINLYFQDKPEFLRHMDYLENLGYHDRVKMLKKLIYDGKESQIAYLTKGGI